MFRAAASYLVTAWVAAQIAQLICEGFETPAWVFQGFLMVLAVGFPVALLLSWIFEITADGIKRDSEVDPVQQASYRPRRIDIIVIAILVITIAMLLITRDTTVCTPVTPAPIFGTGGPV